MILEEFDGNKNAVINPDMVVNKIEDFPDVTISCFSHHLFTKLLEYLSRKKSANPTVPQV